MAISITAGYTFGATEQVTNAKLSALIESATIINIGNSEIASDAAIATSKLTDIAGSKLTTLNTIVAGAGVIPAANLTSVAQKGTNSDITTLSGLTTPISTTQGGTGSTATKNTAGGVVVPTGAVNTANGAVILTAAGKYPALDGSLITGIAAGGYTGMQVFTSSGTWTKPTGITKVLVKVVGGGGGGGGTGGAGSATGGTGGTSSFAGSAVTVEGAGGAGGTATTGGAGGAGSGGTLNLTGLTGLVTSSTNYLNQSGGLPLGLMQISYGKGGTGRASTDFTGGGGGYSEGVIAVSGNVSVSVGAAGAGSDGGGHEGSAGIVVVYW